MISQTVNIKVNNQPSKKNAERTSVDSKKEIISNKKDFNIGLRVPGSNWQKFKSIAEAVASDQTSNNVQIKRKKRNRNNNQKPVITQAQKCTDSVTRCTGISEQTEKVNKTKENEKQTKPHTGLTTVIAMDCEMVGIGDGQDSMIARVSIVNRNGACVYDKYVKPTEEVKDYRTAVSGIRPHHLKNGEDFKTVQKEVSEILKGRTLVGHALHNDLAVLFLSHPKRCQRDTSRYKLFRKITKGSTPSLKKLASELLGIDIQSGEHNSIEDARAAMQLYQLFRKKWETDIRTKR